MQQRTDLTAAGVGRARQLQQNTNIRHDQAVWLDGTTSAQKQYLALMLQLQQQMNRQCFLGLTHHKRHFARYQLGDFYQTHPDAFRCKLNRILATVLLCQTFLNEERKRWSEDSKTTVRIHTETGDQTIPE
ncbi:MAG: hypothetical protein KKB00_09895 [Gammaproteobacteria bacterium]|nr:hypothetical protein [Gammaproteobacteria bacterium]